MKKKIAGKQVKLKYWLDDELWLIRPNRDNTAWEVAGKMKPIQSILIMKDGIFYTTSSGGSREYRYFKTEKDAIRACKKRNAKGLQLNKRIEELQAQVKKSQKQLVKLGEQYYHLMHVDV